MMLATIVPCFIFRYRLNCFDGLFLCTLPIVHEVLQGNFLGRITVLHIVTDRVVWFVSLYVGLSVTLVSPAKTAAPIEMPFGLSTWVGPGNHVLDGSTDPHGRGNFEGGRGVQL